MMPDGSRVVLSAAALFLRQHRELVQWGQIFLRGSTSSDRDRIIWDSDDPVKREWTGQQQEDARLLHSRVIRLPRPEHRIVLQVFYGLNCAERWYQEGMAEHWQQIERDLCPEVNFRLRAMARELGVQSLPVQQWDFAPIRERATRILANSGNVADVAQAQQDVVAKR